MRHLVRHLTLHAALIAAAAAAAPALARAQQKYDTGDGDHMRGPARTYLGGGLLVAQPIGEFRDYVGSGVGVGLHVVQGIDRHGVVGMRFDFGYLIYGHETQRLRPFPRTVADLTTSNNIVLVGIGPQLMLPNGRFRPYVSGTVGLAYFFTETSLSGKDDQENESLFDTNNQKDATFAYTGAAGLYIPVRHGRNPISIDVGARYHANGEAEYLREGGIHDNPDNTYTKDVLRSKTDMITYHLGISVRL